MERYDHGGDIYGNQGVKLDFSVNTNPLGMPKTVCAALIDRVEEYMRYPDPRCRELCAAVARHENVPENWILCGNGAADLIYRLCYAVKPCRAMVCSPTFSEYERALGQAGCHASHYIMAAKNEFTLTDDIVEQLDRGIEILFLCHPNNPTGRLIPADLLERILNRARQNGTVVVVDECFLGFTDGISSKRYLADTPGLIILKAFTKIYAMAGLRLGYLLTSDKVLLDRINAAAQCWSVSVPAQIAGVAALTCSDWLEKTRRLIAAERRFLSVNLSRFRITVLPSDANFILLRSDRPLYEPLLQRGILIRSCENFRGLDGSYSRIGIKTRSENSHLIKAVKEFLHG